MFYTTFSYIKDFSFGRSGIVIPWYNMIDISAQQGEMQGAAAMYSTSISFLTIDQFLKIVRAPIQ